MPTFAGAFAIFLAFVAFFVLVIAWAMNTRDEATIRLVLVAVAVVTSAAAFGIWAVGSWH
jgi:hypothetical protein